MIFNQRKLPLVAATLIACGLSSFVRVNADELIVSFVAELTPATWSGPTSISPFNPASQFGGGVSINPDLIKADGQFVVKDFDSNFTGTYSFAPAGLGSSDAGVEFFLHSPLLERVEAFTTRIGSNSPNGSSTNTKILLPRTASSTTTDELGTTTTGFFGTGSLTVVNGVPTSLSYALGQAALDSFNSEALGLFFPSSMDSLEIDGSQFSLEATFDLDTAGAADAAPYGFNTTLNGSPGSTILDTTRGEIASELAAPFAGGGTGNLLDGKEASGGQPLAFNPLDGTGTLYHYSLDDAVTTSSASTIPEPGTLALLGLAGLTCSCFRRRA